jgi:hypothetical protein
MIYGDSSGSSFYFGKVLVPVPAPVPVLIPVPVPVPDRDFFSTEFYQQKIVQNLAISTLEAAMFPRKLVSIFFIYCTVVVHLCWIRDQIRFQNRNRFRIRNSKTLRCRFLRQKFRFLWLRFRFSKTACEMMASWL